MGRSTPASRRFFRGEVVIAVTLRGWGRLMASRVSNGGVVEVARDRTGSMHRAWPRAGLAAVCGIVICFPVLVWTVHHRTRLEAGAAAT